ncbi:MAG: hypothetical protein Q4B86_03090 [Eubacteriales bacterium]|nr:hypothetical protein [Eubacteriales bacterium]
MATRNGYSPRKFGTILDVSHIVIGIAVVIMAFFAFVSPDRYMIFFPVIFFLSSVLNIMTGWFYIKMYPRVKKKKTLGTFYIIVGLIILVLCIISAISIWSRA